MLKQYALFVFHEKLQSVTVLKTQDNNEIVKLLQWLTVNTFKCTIYYVAMLNLIIRHSAD